MDFKNQEVLDFGTVSFNSSSNKCYEVKNNSSINKTFTVEKNSDDVKFLDSGFKVWPNTSHPVEPGKIFKINVSFTPKVVNTKCSDYLLIKPSFGDGTVVFLKAITDAGAICSLSNTQLKIICPNDQKRSSKKFSITNKGMTVVRFKIFIDNDCSQITLTPAQGKIKPSSSISVTATYTPIDYGPFFKRLFCLIEYHEPLVMDIYASILKPNDSSSLINTKQSLSVFKNNYHLFMNRVMRRVAVNELPLISISESNLDFSHCLPKREKCKEFSLTNNSSMNVLVKWIQNSQKPFKIHPRQSQVDVNSSVAFCASFKPLVKDLLFSAHLEAQVLSDDQLLSFTVDIDLKGHSFDELSCGWAAQYRVEPSKVLLPPCMSQPLIPSHTTLTIHRLGHLPLGFKFHPPKNTNFIVKPQQGLIREHFEIILIQFYPIESNDAIYTEKWMISFNSNEIANHCFVDFEGSVETPKIIINNGQDVVFPKVYPRSPIELLVDFYNPTRFSFWYSESVLKGDTVLMTGSGGEIWPYEHKKVKWSFCPQGVGEMVALVSCTPTMKTKPTIVTVRGICEKTELEVTPHGLLYQGVLREGEHERGFEMTNVGEAFISGSFVWLPGENCSPYDVDLRFEPDNFAILPGSTLLVRVFLTPLIIGSRTILIGYTVNDNTGTPLLPAYISCVFPCLQVSDLRINNTGPLFTKLDFWKSLQINTLNESLYYLTTGVNKETINMYLPSYVSTSETIVVDLLLENRSEIGVLFTVTREKSCDCKPVLTTVSFSRSVLRDICPHKTQVQITPKKVHISPGGFTVLKIQISYSTVGYVENIFNISVVPDDYENFDCIIELCFGRTSIPEGAPYIDNTETRKKDHFVFQMKSVFIGDCYPFVQGFNLYNNTKQSVFYEVNDKSLINTPFKYVGKRTTISPMSNHTLLFTFFPSKCDEFEAEVEFIIDNYPTKLILRGRGVSGKSSEYVNIWLPENEIFNIIDPSPVFLSTSHINAGPMKPTCSQRHLLYLNNNTKDLISFKWRTTKIPEVMELRIHPTKGAIQSGDVVECRLFVYSKGRACLLTSSVTCVFASFTMYSKMAKAMQKYREDAATCADYFVITEGGVENVDLIPPPEEWPRKNYLTVSVDIDIKYDAPQIDDGLLPYTPFVIQTPHFTESLTDDSNKHKLLLEQILEMILMDALKDLWENARTNGTQEPMKRYAQLKEWSTKSDVSVPRHVTQIIIEDLLHCVWQEIFHMKPRNSTEYLRRTLISQLQPGSRSAMTSIESLTKLRLMHYKSGSFDSHNTL